jgi:hypothetical protein
MSEKFLLAIGLTFSISLFTGMSWSLPTKTTGGINFNHSKAFTITQFTW